MKIPLAWLQVSHEKIRFLIALSGIAFADILMFMQLGFLDALFKSSVKLHENLNADIVLISSQTESIVFIESFPRRRLYEIAGLEGIQSVSEMYLGLTKWKNPETGKTRSIFLTAFNPSAKIINLPGVEENLTNLKTEDTVIFDRLSRKEFGNIQADLNQSKTIQTEVSKHKVEVVGLFSLGSSFGADGNIISSDTNFFRILPRKNPEFIDIGLIQLEDQSQLQLTLKFLRQYLKEGDVKILSKEEFIAHEKNYWQNRTPIGFIFLIGTTMGFIVGVVIVYQILYSDVAEHLPEYATLKAMGYTHKTLLIVVLQQGIILACLGFIPGFGFSSLLYFYASSATRLPVIMTTQKVIQMFIITLIMCSISGFIAIRKLKSADPADIFN